MYCLRAGVSDDTMSGAQVIGPLTGYCISPCRMFYWGPNDAIPFANLRQRVGTQDHSLRLQFVVCGALVRKNCGAEPDDQISDEDCL